MLTDETVTLTGVSVAVSPGSGTLTVSPGSGTLTLYASEPAIRITGSLAITEPADTVAVAGHIGDTREPPLLAESLLCIFARAKDIDALMDYFEELFERDCAAGMSRRRANVRYWSKVIRSIGPQILQAARRLGWLGLIMAAFRRLFF